MWCLGSRVHKQSAMGHRFLGSWVDSNSSAIEGIVLDCRNNAE